MIKNMEHIIVYAARYSHVRNTGCPLQVVNFILSEWENLSEFTRKQLYLESFDARYCREDWNRLQNRYEGGSQPAEGTNGKKMKADTSK